MKILVVDDEEIIVESLVEIIRSYAEFQVEGVLSGPDAVARVDEMGGVDLLITDVVMDRMDGFALRDSLRRNYPALEVVFVTGYDLSDYAANVGGSVILAKPIHSTAILQEVHRVWEKIHGPGPDPSSLLAPAPEHPPADDPAQEKSEPRPNQSADLRSLVQKQGSTGALDLFQLVDIIQMCCMSRRTGRLRVTHAGESGVISLKEGNMIHGVVGDLSGENAVYQVIAWDVGQFTFEYGIESDLQTILVGWEHVVMEGCRRRDENKIAPAAPPLETDRSLVGTVLGGYEIVQQLSQSATGDTFQAIQATVNRPVAMRILNAELARDAARIQEFVADASIKANVQHPAIVSVYEAGQANGHYFYTREYIDGATLADYQAQGAWIDEQMALRILRVVAEALSYFSANKISRAFLDAKSIYLTAEGQPRLVNLAQLKHDPSAIVQKEIQELSRIVSASLPPVAEGSSRPIKAILSRMRIDGSGGYLSYGALLQAVKALEPTVVPLEAYKMNERDRAAIKAVDDAKKRQRRTLILSTVGLFLLVWAVLGALYFIFHGRPKVTNELIKIPAGPFLYQAGQTLILPDFWIDKYEVTIAQYADFLDSLEKNPTTKYDAPNQPTGKSHKPLDWDRFYPKAKSSSTYEYSPISLDTPIFNVDWYDAYAFAKWENHRLPTEQEWEKAARGPSGNIFAWGNEFDARKLNSSVDYNSDPTKGGEKDGYNRWAPVNQHPGDVSPYGVMDLTGNVSEWTASTEKVGGFETPVIRGGSFRLPDYELSRRRLDSLQEIARLSVGFRTVSDTPPPPKS